MVDKYKVSRLQFLEFNGAVELDNEDMVESLACLDASNLFIESSHSGFPIEATQDLPLAVADGTRLCSKAVCKNLSWEMQGIMFSAEVRLLSLGGCDMDSGIQWLSTLGPILWDFRNLSMQFHLQRKPVDLKGETQLKVEQVNSKQFGKTVRSTKQGFLAYMCSMDAVEENNQVHSDIKVILQEFCDVFEEPKTLPPQRNADHKIPLKGGGEPVHVKSYRQEWDPSSSAEAISVAQTDWLLDLKQSWSTDRDLQALITDLTNDPTSHEGYSWHHDLLNYKGKLVVGSVGHIKTQILQELHGSPVGGHSGTERTYKRLWTDISMDFIEGFPLSNGKSVIFVVADRLSKYVHFMALSHPYTAADIRVNHKLAPRFYGPYQIIQKVGQVAYKLALPSSRIQPVFHVSLLKRKLGQQVVAQADLPPVNEAGLLAPQPVAIFYRRLVKRRGKAATQLLVQWANTFPEEASWEFYTHLQAKYPQFLPCGQGSQQGEGMIHTYPELVDSWWSGGS
ncbi:hypothetical protein RHSIM_Rhsim09G0000300 [Rhododendron simsii]|uniref:Tf2-1-like SH3-like domain-containing protein n=1 Tax=Rhododendron simsii TaxID=118357 RepID=A0A834GD19_RHOSS|nr:hypothetical protein RHSIM_Rhsim09G0000300 [Rhododendron simsii]